MAIIKNPFMVVGDKNPLIANTEEEMTALLASKNIGKAVKYVGEGGGAAVGTPPAVGDTIDKLYFNTSVEPDLSGLTYEGGEAYLLETSGAYIGAYDMSAFDMSGYMLLDTNNYTVFYATEPISLGNINAVAGWQNLTDGAYSLGETLEVATVNQQDLWSSYISKEPFAAGGAYEKDTLYVVSGEEAGAVGTPFEVGDIIDKVYFNTDAEPDFSKLTLSEDGETVLFSVMGIGQFSVTDLSIATGGAINALAICPEENGGLPIYSTEAFDLEGLTISKGWSADLIANNGIYQWTNEDGGGKYGNDETYYSNGAVCEINQQDAWSDYISKEPFTSGGGDVVLSARKLKATKGSLKITENGTFDVSEKESVTVNIASVDNLEKVINGTLTEVVSNASTIAAHAFYRNTSLTSVKFPLATRVGQSAFQNCSSLARVDLGAVEHIEGYALSDNTALTTVILRGSSVVTCEQTNELRGTPFESGGGTIYVPDDLVDSYKTSTWWGTNYSAQIKGLSELAE